MSHSNPSKFGDRFQSYFLQAPAQQASRPLKEGATLEFQVLDSETFHLVRNAGSNLVKPGKASDPDLTFKLTRKACERILGDPEQDIGKIGVAIARMMVTQQLDEKISIQLNCGFLRLFQNGYLGVLSTGGSAFAAFLAERGLSGLGGFKKAIQILTRR